MIAINQDTIGQMVRVIGATDDTIDVSYWGRTGKVSYFDYNCGCGQSEGDPMIGVEFGENDIEEFWKEELKTA